MRSPAAGELNAINLKAVLWETLKGVRAGKLTPSQGDVVASQAREILRTSKVQLAIFGQAGQGVSQELIDFAKPTRGQR
jgi:hypothetical protein